MLGSTSTNLKQRLFEAVDAHLRPSGFELEATKDRFVRRCDEIIHIFQLVCLDGKPGWRIQPNVAVRIEIVEQIFHKHSGFEKKYQADTPTIGGAVGNIGNGDNQACEFLLETPLETAAVSDKIAHVFTDFGLPYFHRFSSLPEIDRELNDHPKVRTPNRVVPWLRCATGLIVAKLVRRPNYKELASIYSSTMKMSDKGFYFDRFCALADYLEKTQFGDTVLECTPKVGQAKMGDSSQEEN